jgi:beta-phosphoglucomutase
MIRAFVFDLDGTLVETEELKALSYARAAAELRPDLNEGEVIEAFKDLVGLSRQEVAVGLMRRFGLEGAARTRMTRRRRPQRVGHSLQRRSAHRSRRADGRRGE